MNAATTEPSALDFTTAWTFGGVCTLIVDRWDRAFPTPHAPSQMEKMLHKVEGALRH